MNEEIATLERLGESRAIAIAEGIGNTIETGSRLVLLNLNNPCSRLYTGIGEYVVGIASCAEEHPLVSVKRLL